MHSSVLFLRRTAAAYLLFLLVPPAAHSQAGAALRTHGIVVAHEDRSIKPGDDFAAYANGAWSKRAVIPSDSYFSTPYGLEYDDANNDRKRSAVLIAEAVKTNAGAGSNLRKVADLYTSFMDEAAVESRGLAGLRPQLDRIAAIRNPHELARVLGETLRADADPLNCACFHTANLFGLWVAPGFNDPEHYVAYLLQGGLEMPDRDYYLADSTEMRDIRAKYQAHVAAMLKLAGLPDASVRAQHVIELEHAIAERHVALADEQDVEKANNTWTAADFVAHAPGLDWTEYFRGAGLAGQRLFIIWQPTAFSGESALVAARPLEVWKEWLTYHVIEDYAEALPRAFVNERFAFFRQTLQGTMQLPARPKLGVDLVNALLGHAVGQMYAQRYFSDATNLKAQAIVRDVIAAYRRRIAALPWMDSATKAQADAKLTHLYVGIGHPEAWRDYSQFEVKADDLFGNLWRGRLFEYQRVRARLGLLVDRTDWPSYYPQSIDAQELPLQNAINIPAAYLQPPNFDPDASAAFNYGAFGAVVGHEISHTFDPEGSAFDFTGRLHNWWKPVDLAHFRAATARLVEQYDAYRPFHDLPLNGKQTLAENVADLAGLAAAYDAFHASLDGGTVPDPDGLSADQQFFLAFAQMWATKVNASYLRQQVMTDVHSPEKYRIDTVRNLDPWYAAFFVKPEEKLYLAPADRIRIW